MINSLQPPIPPLAQACSSYPIQNSQFPNSKFSLHSPHSTTAHCPPLFWRGGTGVRTPLAQAYRLCPIQNSKFRIHNSKCATPFGKLSEFVKVFSVNLFQDMTISPYFSSSLLLGLLAKQKIQSSKYDHSFGC